MPSEQEYLDAIEELKRENQEIKSNNSLLGGSQQIHEQNQSPNLIQWQLDIEQELELIERLLRGHRLVRDKEGNQKWEEPEDEDEALFNEKGVQEVMKFVRMYINKNLLLSNFSEEQINIRVRQFGERLTRFIYLNYEDFGMDTYYKQKHFEMVVMNFTDMIESAYMRALNGGERRSLREARTVTQNESVNPYPMNNPSQKSFSLNPFKSFRK